MKWKSALNSSSIPLEFETAKILVNKGFTVFSDYSYSRNDLGIKKDFSVDIHARGEPPFRKDSKLDIKLDLLIECKQRHSGNQWLFLPDINNSEYTNYYIGETMHGIDNYSKYFFEKKYFTDFDDKFCFCYKGVEIDTSNNKVHADEIKHGIYQLQYALPRLYKEHIANNLSCPPNINFPFMYCAILLTTSDLFIAHKSFSIRNVDNIKESINEIAKKVPYLILYNYCNPDFMNHCKEEFSLFKHFYNTQKINEIEDYRKKNNSNQLDLPITTMYSLMNGFDLELSKYFSQFIVCSLRHFSRLIDQINNIAIQATENIK